MHTDDVRCSNCAWPPVQLTPFEENLKTVTPSVLTRALGKVLKDGPCEVPGCFVCEPKRIDQW